MQARLQDKLFSVSCKCNKLDENYVWLVEPNQFLNLMLISNLNKEAPKGASLQGYFKSHVL